MKHTKAMGHASNNMSLAKSILSIRTTMTGTELARNLEEAAKLLQDSAHELTLAAKQLRIQVHHKEQLP